MNMQSSVANPAYGLEEEKKATSCLIELLKKEQAQLVNAEIDELARLTDEKAKVVARLSDLAKLRHDALVAAGFPGKEAGMKAWLDKTPGLDLVHVSWSELLELIKAAKEFNRVNGLLISKHMIRNQNALQVLQGSKQGGNLYGPNGQSTLTAPTRSLIIG
jgi:flagellar biosynthesis protein FlgN